MKMVYCKLCGDLVQMKRFVRGCSCGNVCGRYDRNNLSIELKINREGSASVVGINMDLLTGKFVRRTGGFDNPQYKNSLFGREKSHIVVTIPFTTGDVRPLKETWMKPVDEGEWKKAGMHNQ